MLDVCPEIARVAAEIVSDWANGNCWIGIEVVDSGH